VPQPLTFCVQPGQLGLVAPGLDPLGEAELLAELEVEPPPWCMTLLVVLPTAPPLRGGQGERGACAVPMQQPPGGGGGAQEGAGLVAQGGAGPEEAGGRGEASEGEGAAPEEGFLEEQRGFAVGASWGPGPRLSSRRYAYYRCHSDGFQWTKYGEKFLSSAESQVSHNPNPSPFSLCSTPISLPSLRDKP